MCNRLTVCATALCITLVAGPLLADKPVYDTPEAAAADPDFALQGEYRGQFTTEDGQILIVGAQVIALGNGAFRIVGFSGGLPGDGPHVERQDGYDARRIGDTITLEVPFADTGPIMRAIIRGGSIHLSINDQPTFAELPKIERRSPTIGRKPPEGAVVLFDGTRESLKNWRDGARITEDGLLMQGVTSRKTFGDHTVHVEFRLPYEPHARGQARGNSGIYLQGRYEVQMLDSFGLTGEHNECGGIYSVKKPDVNMCYPPLAWQTYDIDFTAARFDDQGNKTAHARMTVRHNGVMIHDNIEVPHATAAAPIAEGPAPGPVYLQDHGNPVRYRNIWVAPR